MEKEVKKISKKKKVLIIFMSILIVLIVLFSGVSIISVIGNYSILSIMGNYTSISSTHSLEVQKNNNGYTTIKNTENNEPLKILQISDIHICCSIGTYNNDKKALDNMYQMITNTQPDLIVITGDAIYPFLLTLSTNNKLQSSVIGTFFENVGIYWTIVFGNHDGHSLFKTADNNYLSNYYSGLSHCLFETGDDNVDGYGNYIIKSLNYDNSLNKVLVFMDSNAYTCGINKYDKIHDNQITWYENELNAIALSESTTVDNIYSLMFFHIPLTAYKTAVELYKTNSSEVTYYYGSYGEKSCTPDVQEDFFSKIVSLGSTKAIFVGHDHLNNFCMKYKGVLLNYGMSIDYTAYIGIHNKTEQRGGTLILLNENSDISIVQVPQSNNFQILESNSYNYGA